MDSRLTQLLRESAVPDSSAALERTLLGVGAALGDRAPARSRSRRRVAGAGLGLAALVAVLALTPVGQAGVDLFDGSDAPPPAVVSTALVEVGSGQLAPGASYEVLVNRPAQFAATEPDGVCFTVTLAEAAKALTSCSEVPGQDFIGADPASQQALAAPTALEASKVGLETGTVVYGLIAPEAAEVSVASADATTQASVYRPSAEVQAEIGATRALGFYVAVVSDEADLRVSAVDAGGERLGSVAVADHISRN